MKIINYVLVKIKIKLRLEIVCVGEPQMRFKKCCFFVSPFFVSLLCRTFLFFLAFISERETGIPGNLEKFWEIAFICEWVNCFMTSVAFV